MSAYGKFKPPVVKVDDNVRDHEMIELLNIRYNELKNIRDSLEDLKNRMFENELSQRISILITTIDTSLEKLMKVLNGQVQMEYINLRAINRSLELLFNSISAALQEIIKASRKESIDTPVDAHMVLEACNKSVLKYTTSV